MKEHEKFNADYPVLLKVKYESEVFTVDEVANLLKAYTDEFNRFIDPELLIINDIKKGSLEIALQEIVEYLGVASPIIAENGIFKLFQDLKSLVDLFKEKLPTKDEAINNNINAKECDNLSNILHPVAKDSANQVNISVVNDESVHYHFHINGEQASSIRNRAQETKKILNEPSIEQISNEPFKFKQIRQELKTGIGDRIIVPSISDRPLKVKYDDILIKEQIVEADENTFRFTFYGDLNILYKNDVPDTCIIRELNDLQLDE